METVGAVSEAVPPRGLTPPLPTSFKHKRQQTAHTNLHLTFVTEQQILEVPSQWELGWAGLRFQASEFGLDCGGSGKPMTE